MRLTDLSYRQGLANGLNLALDLASQAETAEDIRKRIGQASAIASKLRCDRDFHGGLVAEIRRQVREHFRQLEASGKR
jgi:hypothetical protein